MIIDETPDFVATLPLIFLLGFQALHALIVRC